MTIESQIRKIIRKKVLLEIKSRLILEDTNDPTPEEYAALAQEFERKSGAFQAAADQLDISTLTDVAIQINDLIGPEGKKQDPRVAFSGDEDDKIIDLLRSEISTLQEYCKVFEIYIEIYGQNWYTDFAWAIKNVNEQSDINIFNMKLKNYIEGLPLFKLDEENYTVDDFKNDKAQLKNFFESDVVKEVTPEQEPISLEYLKYSPFIVSPGFQLWVDNATTPNDFMQENYPADEYPDMIQDFDYYYNKAASIAKSLSGGDTPSATRSTDPGAAAATPGDPNCFENLPPLQSGSVGEYVQKIRKLLNMHLVNMGPGFAGIKIADENSTLWNDQCQLAWLAVVKRILKDRKYLSDKGYSESSPWPGASTGSAEDGVGSWNLMASYLVKDFPGYTKGPRGCLAFLMDGYCGEAKYGNMAPPSVTRRPSGQNRASGDTGGGKTRVVERIPDEKIGIRLIANANNGGPKFKDHGFKLPGGNDPDRAFAGVITRNMNVTTHQEGHPGGTMTFYMQVDKNKTKIEDVDLLFTSQRLSGLFKRPRMIERAIKSLLSRLEFPSAETSAHYAKNSGSFDIRRGGPKRYIIVNVDIGAGGY